MSNISIHIITTYSNKDRQESILNTWLKNHDQYVFYTDFDSGIGNQIELTTNTQIDSGGEKHILEIQRIIREKLFNKHEWFYFCDDDTIVNMNKLYKFCEHVEKNKVYGAVGNTWPEDRSLFYLSGGAGYLVHSDIFKNKNYPRLKRIIWGDVQFGIWLKEQNIKPIHVDEFKWDHPKQFNLDINNSADYDMIKSNISFHYIKTNTDREIINNIFK